MAVVAVSRILISTAVVLQLRELSLQAEVSDEY
jgi:hypothetical protein